ncbi:hypothetical protein GGX14DRAFT_574188 [Mycena pura]|uniref:Uncharacterized protein n=1 Tax=Mycena pura TaxID=153505 RepID=A0AAD6V1K9_9AGAR|nr:hypothetical protein GGX14DRAFT_574188 [Mycena pura]
MPSHPSVTQTRLNRITTCLAATVETMDILSNTFKTPFLQPISTTTHSLVTLMQTVNQNKSDCAMLLEQTDEVLNAIIAIHIKSEEATASLTPSMLDHVADFAK